MFMTERVTLCFHLACGMFLTQMRESKFSPAVLVDAVLHAPCNAAIQGTDNPAHTGTCGALKPRRPQITARKMASPSSRRRRSTPAMWKKLSGS